MLDFPTSDADVEARAFNIEECARIAVNKSIPVMYREMAASFGQLLGDFNLLQAELVRMRALQLPAVLAHPTHIAPCFNCGSRVAYTEKVNGTWEAKCADCNNWISVGEKPGEDIYERHIQQWENTPSPKSPRPGTSKTARP